MALYQGHDRTCFRVSVNKSFESDPGDLRGANGVGQQYCGQRVAFEKLFTRGRSLIQTSVPLPGGLIKTPEDGRSADTENRER